MSKHIIITLVSIFAVLSAMIAGAYFSFSSIESKAVDEENNTVEKVKVGKYFKENGTEQDYIEVFEDGTIQLFGYNFYDEIMKNSEKEIIENLSKTDIDNMKIMTEYYLKRHKYKYIPQVRFIDFEDSPYNEQFETSGYGFSYDNENTIVLSRSTGFIYKYAE